MPNLEELYGHFLTLNTLFTLIIAFPTMYIVNAKTLRHYANCILNIIIVNLALNLYGSTFYRIIPLYPAFCYKNNGILRYFAANDTVAYYSILFNFSCYFNITAAIVILQVYRFLQTVCKKSVENITKPIGYSCAAVIHFFATIIAILICQQTRAPPSKYQEIYKDNAYFLKELQDPTVICFERDNILFLNVAFCGVVGVVVSMSTFLQFISVRHLETQKSSLSLQAYEQQRKLSLHLLAIAVVPIFCGGIPFEMIFISLLFNNSYMQAVAVICSGLCLLHLNIFCIFVLILFKSYRFATKALLYKMMQMTPTVTAGPQTSNMVD
uniref:G_PROTEIN_RECEP_F1_2 domain-containing protein n=1 Tax=Steinernema glaseri TaxID=37863 RepID=A0A1I7YJC0_9BILA